MMNSHTKNFRKLRVALAAFTLAELLVSAAIMSALVAGILVSYIRCMELNEASKNKSLALKAARSKMEEIRNADFSTLIGTYNNVSFNVSGFNGKGVSYVTSLDAKNSRVIVSVSWQQKNGRVYGEDKDLDGVLDAGEDNNADTMLNSPVDITTRVFDRS